LLPDFLAPKRNGKFFLQVSVPKIESTLFQFLLAWNPRLLRLNSHATRKRDWLDETLAAAMAQTGR
jgi:hypothetical protein